jgi:hypothetical protein
MHPSNTQQPFLGKAVPLRNFGLIYRRLRIDGPLLGGILLICALGLVVLYSAVGENMRLWTSQIVRCRTDVARLPETLDPMGVPGWHRLAGIGPDDR